MIARRSSGRAFSTASSWPCPTITCCWRPMPVSESSSWMSSSRHGAPLIMYSDSPVRNSVRVIVTSENSIGSSRAVLSIVSDDLGPAERGAVGGAGEDDVVHLRRRAAPARPARRAPTRRSRRCSTCPTRSGPTTTQTPGSKSSVVLSAKDLKPFSVSDRRNNAAPFSDRRS